MFYALEPVQGYRREPLEGLGVAWPGGDAAILALVGWYVVAAAGYIERLRRHAGHLVPQNAR